jgi:hypothetical protein
VALVESPVQYRDGDAPSSAFTTGDTATALLLRFATWTVKLAHRFDRMRLFWSPDTYVARACARRHPGHCPDGEAADLVKSSPPHEAAAIAAAQPAFKISLLESRKVCFAGTMP